jgi:hypothetical protein
MKTGWLERMKKVAWFKQICFVLNAASVALFGA